MSKTIVTKIHGNTAPFQIWDIYNNELQPYNEWCLEWFIDFRLTDSIELWDNNDWLQELYEGNKEHKKEFKKFVVENYTVEWKKVYKEFKEIWELKDKLNGDITPKLEDVVTKDETFEVIDWNPTMELRYKRINSKSTPLQQKWINNNGDEEWRTIKIE